MNVEEFRDLSLSLACIDHGDRLLLSSSLAEQVVSAHSTRGIPFAEN